MDAIDMENKSHFTLKNKLISIKVVPNTTGR